MTHCSYPEICNKPTPCVVCRFDAQSTEAWVRPACRVEEKVNPPPQKPAKPPAPRKPSQHEQERIRQIWVEEATASDSRVMERVIERLQSEGITWGQSTIMKYRGKGYTRPRTRPIRQIDAATGEIIAEYPTIKSAKEAMSCTGWEIIQTAKGRRDTYLGCRWEYI